MIYKTFEKFNKNKIITIADYLKALDLTSLPQPKYRKIKFTYDSLLKLTLYQHLKHIRFYAKLAKHLKRNPMDKFKLGFTRTPNRAHIGYFNNHILDQTTKDTITYMASKIEEISEKFGILLDITTLTPEPPQKETKERNHYHLKKDKIQDLCRLFKKRIAPFINLHLKSNAIYTKNHYIDLLIHLGLTQDFAENGSKTFKELKGPHNPDADTLLYHLKHYDHYPDIHRMFTTLFEVIWEMTKTAHLFDTHKKYDVAIDFTEWYYYGDRGTPMIVGKKPERGTTKCYKFATLTIVETTKRFTMLAVPVGPFDNKHKILETLLTYAQERIKINRLYVDRGFFDSDSIKLFQHHHLTYLMPCTQISTVKNLLNITPAPAVITDFPLADTTFTMVVLQETKENGEILKYAFATNEHYDEHDVTLTERLFHLYGKRWGIETSYRVKKHSYLPKTTSKNYLIRLFYFMFSVLLYNLWILADILLCLALFGFIKDDHQVTSKYFGTILYTIDPGG